MTLRIFNHYLQGLNTKHGSEVHCKQMVFEFDMFVTSSVLLSIMYKFIYVFMHL